MLPYIGGKYLQAKWMNEYIPDGFDYYAEVFGGAFWMYLRTDIYKNVKKAYYNDINVFMVNMFECIKHKEYIIHLDIPSQQSDLFTLNRDKVITHQNKSNNKIMMPDFELGTAYPYVLSQIFSGQVINEKIKMFDMKGKYNSKFDTFKNRVKDEIIQEKMTKVTVKNLDYSDFIKETDHKDMFFYVDPPYFELEDYYTFNTFFDHKALAEQLKNIKGKFMLSYYDFDGLAELFPKDQYTWVEKEFAKRAGVKMNKKTPKGKEVLIMNYKNQPNEMKEW